MKRVLVTGCGGFVGPYVVDAFVRAGYRVWGVDVRENVPNASLEGYVSRDLCDRHAVESLMGDTSPEAVVHLAAQSSAGKSFSEPFDTLMRNIWPVLNLLDVARKRGRGVRILAVGSGDVYGPVSESELPLRENRAPNPVNPYALSKAIQEQCCLQYAALYGVDVIATRSFNHTGAGQRESFVLPSFARQVAEIRLGAREPVMDVGALDLKRDFTDVRDVALAYVALVEKGKRGEVYNVCSGVAHSLRDLLAAMCNAARVAPEIRVDPRRVRSADIAELRGDPSKIARDTGWRSRVPIAETIEWLIGSWTSAIEEARERKG